MTNKELLEKLREMTEQKDANGGGACCPNCGHCPTCGRRNAAPWYPVQPYYRPYWIIPNVWGYSTTDTFMGTTSTATAETSGYVTYNTPQS